RPAGDGRHVPLQEADDAGRSARRDPAHAGEPENGTEQLQLLPRQRDDQDHAAAQALRPQGSGLRDQRCPRHQWTPGPDLIAGAFTNRSASRAAIGIRHRSAWLAFHSARIHNSTLKAQATTAAPRKTEKAAGAKVSISRPNAAHARMSSARPPKAMVACAAWKRTSSSRRSTTQKINPVTHHPMYASVEAVCVG